jgi:hypothetical protein
MSMAGVNEILNQFPRGFTAMIGATQFVDLGDGVKFRFKGSKAANLVIIRLTARDTYDVEFYKMAKFDHVQIAVVEDVYGDQLRRVFEHMTKLRLSL